MYIYIYIYICCTGVQSGLCAACGDSKFVASHLAMEEPPVAPPVPPPDEPPPEDACICMFNVCFFGKDNLFKPLQNFTDRIFQRANNHKTE